MINPNPSTRAAASNKPDALLILLVVLPSPNTRSTHRLELTQDVLWFLCSVLRGAGLAIVRVPEPA